MPFANENKIKYIYIYIYICRYAPPLITGVNVIQVGESVYIDLGIKMYGETNIIIKAGSGPINVTAKLKNLEVVGTMRIMLAPLGGVLPCFQAMSMSFTKKPQITFDLGGSLKPIPRTYNK